MTKRLQQELMTLMTSGQKGISAFPEGDKLFAWVATVEGPQESVYAGEEEGEAKDCSQRAKIKCGICFSEEIVFYPVPLPFVC